MSDVTKKTVLAVIKNSSEAMSVTGISKELGFSKKNAQVCTFLNELVYDGSVNEDQEGSFVKYSISKADKSTKAVAPVAKETKTTNPVNTSIQGFDPSNVRIPVDLHGWKIEENAAGFKVSTPDGAVHQITKTQRVLVINKEDKLLVDEPEEVLLAIDQFCRNNQYTSYLVKDLSLGRHVLSKDVSTNPCLIFVEVTRHNKAGF